MRSLAAPIGGSAVALPISLSGDEPAGQITSLKNLFLDDHDFAIALRAEVFTGMVERCWPRSALILKYVTTISPFVGPSYHIHHTARVTSATAAWEATGGDHVTVRADHRDVLVWNTVPPRCYNGVPCGEGVGIRGREVVTRVPSACV